MDNKKKTSMGIQKIFSDSFFNETLLFNSIILIKKNMFFLVFSYFIICTKLLSIHLFNRNQISSTKNNFFENFEKQIIPVIDLQTKKNKDYVDSFIQIESEIYQLFSFQTKKKFSYIILYFFDRFSFFHSNEVIIIRSTKQWDQKNVFYFKNFFCFGKEKKGFYLGRIFFYPYFFVKFFKIMKYFEKILKIDFLPHLSLVYNDLGNYYFFFIKKMKKIYSFIQVGKKKNEKPILVSFTQINRKLEIFIALLFFNRLETFVLKFEKKKIKCLNLCASTETLTLANFYSITWGGIFSKFLITGCSDGKIFLWNEVLIPMLEIRYFCASIKDLKIFPKSGLFLVVIKREGLNFQEKRKILKKLPQTTLNIYYFQKIQTINFNFFSNFVNILNSHNLQWFFLNYFKKKILKNHCIKGGGILFSIGKLVLMYVEKKNEIYNFLNFFFFKKIFNFYQSKRNYLYDDKGFFKKNLFFFRFDIVCRLRKFSIREIKYEQKLLLECKKSFFYYKCIICERVSKKVIELGRRKFCPFFHSQNEKHIKWEKEKGYLYDRKIFNRWNFLKKLIYFPLISRNFSFKRSKFFFLQKEISGII